MKHFISIILLSLLLVVSYAKAPQNNKIKLLSKPSAGSKIVNVVNPWQKLIPFYRRRGWLKVGDPSTGKVGWINLKQYYDAILSAPRRPTVQSVFVHVVSKPDKNGKYEIIVYKNGKKLGKKQAAKVLRKITARQKYMERRFHRMQRQMDRMFDQPMRDFDSLDVMAPWLNINRDRFESPIIIFVRPRKN
jgi:hypothetical protein